MVATRRQERVENALSTPDVRRSGRDRKPVETLISLSELKTKPTTNNRFSSSGKIFMNKKEAKISQSKGWAQIRKEQEKQLQDEKRRKTMPNMLTDPYTNETVWVSTATLQDIAIANKKHKPPWPLYQRHLVMVPSVQQRQIVYDRAAAAISELEQRILPSYGGRLQWTCIVTIKEQTTATASTTTVSSTKKSKKANDTTNKKSPYFCWNKRGQLELAAWPYMIEKIPNPPHFPGYYKNGTVHSRSATSTSSRSTTVRNKTKSPTSDSKTVTNILDQPVPQCPPEENEEIPSLLISHPPNETVTPLTTAVIVNETDAVEVVADSHCIQQQMVSDIREDGADASPNRIYHPTTTHIMSIVDPNATTDVNVSTSDSNEIVEEEEQDDEDDDEDEDEEEELSEDVKQLRELQERAISGLAELAFQERWRVSIPTIHYKWISPLQQTFYTRKSAWENAIELCKNDVLLDKVLHGYGANGKLILPKLPTQSATFNAGKLRFVRDGLWIVGQEEQWIHERMNEEEIDAVEKYVGPKNLSDNTISMVPQPQPQPQRPWTGLSLFIHKTRAQYRDERVKERSEETSVNVVTPPPSTATMASTNSDTDSSSSSLSTHPIAPATPRSINSVTQVTCGVLLTPPLKGNKELLNGKSDFKYTLLEATKDLRVIWKSMADEEKLKWNTEADNQNKLEGKASIFIVPSSPLPASLVLTNQSSINSKKSTHVDRFKKWSLNEQQIQSCYDAGMEHYDQIMRTVTARDLFRELQDGFDLLRERGKGRWDMNLPEFDTSTYAFLNDTKKSPWMPIVREILGKEVVLIHKGIFLSMPGSSKQVYHQDGPHLTTQYQKQCHAINVFVPLVDLELDNGPTEFCLGSHILGYDGLDEDYVTTPTVSAGTPIIFDYRLGHRGLGNSSKTCRPIVYCTYAACGDGKEFRDSVNFSRKRYHRIGELVEKGLTRAERAEKRQRT